MNGKEKNKYIHKQTKTAFTASLYKCDNVPQIKMWDIIRLLFLYMNDINKYQPFQPYLKKSYLKKWRITTETVKDLADVSGQTFEAANVSCAILRVD